MKKLLLYAFVFCIPYFGFAQEEANTQSNKWQFSITPSIWLTGSDGDFAVNNINNIGSLEASFTSSTDDLVVTPGLVVEVKKGRWSIMAESNMLSLDKRGSLTNSFDGVNLGDVSNTKFDQLNVELGGAYSFVKLNTFTFDFLFGARYVSAKTEIRGGLNNLLYENDIDYIDPYIGTRFTNYWGKFGIGARIDVGGFEIGSEVTYRYNFMLGYEVAEFLEVQLAYQYSEPLYEEANFSYNVSTDGPLLGFKFKF